MCPQFLTNNLFHRLFSFYSSASPNRVADDASFTFTRTNSPMR
jgi:hypothetical protein